MPTSLRDAVARCALWLLAVSCSLDTNPPASTLSPASEIDARVSEPTETEPEAGSEPTPGVVVGSGGADDDEDAGKAERECKPGRRECLNAIEARSCSENGRWTAAIGCELGCLDGRCAECRQGSAACMDTLRRFCGDDGRWRVSRCAHGCSGDACNDCSPDQAECTDNGTSARSCSSGGRWQAAVSCSHGCIRGRCNDCRPGERRCRDDQEQTCTAEGTWGPGNRCGEGCAADHCASCRVGIRQCFGKGLHACNSEGTWELVAECEDGCNEGLCNSCTPDAKRCSDRGVQTCGADRRWGAPSACRAGCDGDHCAECANGSSDCSSKTSVRVCVDKRWREAESCRPNSSCDATRTDGNHCPCDRGFRDPHPNPGLCTEN